MRVEGTLFSVYFFFFVVVTTVYWLWSGDPTGTACLALVGGLSVMIGYYLLFTARRMEARPEDLGDAEISDGVGEMGFFSPHSYWPILTAAAFTLTTLGAVIGPWLLAIGVLAVLISVSGFLFEYYVGINRSQSQTLGALETMGESPTSAHKFLGD